MFAPVAQIPAYNVKTEDGKPEQGTGEGHPLGPSWQPNKENFTDATSALGALIELPVADPVP